MQFKRVFIPEANQPKKKYNEANPIDKDNDTTIDIRLTQISNMKNKKIKKDKQKSIASITKEVTQEFGQETQAIGILATQVYGNEAQVSTPITVRTCI